MSPPGPLFQSPTERTSSTMPGAIPSGASATARRSADSRRDPGEVGGVRDDGTSTARDTAGASTRRRTPPRRTAGDRA